MRLSLSVLVIVTFALLGAACASGRGSSPAQAIPATIAPVVTATIQGKVSFMLSEDPAGLRGFQTVVEAFNTVQPGVTVELVNVADANEFVKRLAADFAARTAPDVFLINYRRFGQFAIKGALEPLAPYIEQSATIKLADYYPVALEAFTFKNQLQCMPQNLSSLQVYYNKTLFTQAGVPLPQAGWTWGDFLSAARALTRDTNGDGKVDQYGVGVAAQALRLIPFIWMHGGEIVDNLDRPTKLTLDTPVAREAFQWFVDLQVKEKVAPHKVDEAAENSQTRFEHGTLGMFLNSRVVTPEFRATAKGFEWDIAPMPGDKHMVTMLHSDGYCITSASQNKAAAWAFVEFMAGQEGQKTLVASGRTVPSSKSVAESPAFLQVGPPASNQVYLDVAPHIRRVPVMTTWLEIESLLNREIQRAFYGDASVADVIKAALEATQPLIDQNLKDLGSP